MIKKIFYLFLAFFSLFFLYLCCIQAYATIVAPTKPIAIVDTNLSATEKEHMSSEIVAHGNACAQALASSFFSRAQHTPTIKNVANALLQKFPSIQRVHVKKNPHSHKTYFTIKAENPIISINNQWYLTATKKILPIANFIELQKPNIFWPSQADFVSGSSGIAQFAPFLDYLLSLPSEIFCEYTITIECDHRIVYTHNEHPAIVIITALDAIPSNELLLHCKALLQQKGGKWCADARFKGQLIVRKIGDSHEKSI